MQAFLNELSLPNLHSDDEVIDIFAKLGVSYQTARQHGISEIKIASSFYNHLFAPNYRYYNWLEDNKKTIDSDLRTLLKSILGTTPVVDEILDTYQRENELALEMSIDKTSCIGLGLASELVFNTVAFSFANMGWDLPVYNVSITQFQEDPNGNIIDVISESNSKNIEDITHINSHSEFIIEEVKKTIESGNELWERKNSLFPNLDFCISVRNDLAGMNYNTLGFHSIKDVLFDIQNVAANMNGREIKPENFAAKTSKESETRLRNFKNELTKMCPDNNYRLFDWHCRFTPGAGRIYFFPFQDQNRILIGIIGNQNTVK
jgi:hypothetical protein